MVTISNLPSSKILTLKKYKEDLRKELRSLRQEISFIEDKVTGSNPRDTMEASDIFRDVEWICSHATVCRDQARKVYRIFK